MTKKVMKTKSSHFVVVTHNAIKVDTGLVVAIVDGAVDGEIARQVLTQHVMNGNAESGIEFPKAKIVRSWHGGGERNKAHVEAANSIYPEPPAGVKRFVRSLEVDHRFNWLSDAAFMVMGKTIKGTEKQSAQGDWNVILQNGVTLDDPGTMHALFKLRQVAKTAGNHVMVIIGGANKLQDAAEKLFPMCDEVITIEVCEADPDAYSAFKIAIPSLHHSHQFGKGVVMASLARCQGKFKIKIEPFIATELKQRVAWRLYGAGKSLDDIGEYLTVNKSTASRWLQKMPPVVKLSMTDKEIEQALEAIECLPSEKKKAQPCPAFSVQHSGQSNRKVR